MASYRFPVLVWNHPDGKVTAAIVEDHRNMAAVGQTRSDALAQLKEWLHWAARRAGQISPPNFGDPSLTWMKFDIRPEYNAKNRPHPCKETIQLRLPVVMGKSSAGTLLCCLPTVGIRFDYDDVQAFPQLAAHYVQVGLKGRTPRDIARYLAPSHALLEDVVIQVRPDDFAAEGEIDLAPLPEVADALGDRAARGRLSRPWGRDEQVDRLVKAMADEKRSVLLLGESGAGKSAVLAEAARKTERLTAGRHKTEDEEDQVRKEGVNVRRRFWLTNASRLISGMKYLGQWQERCEAIIGKLREVGGVLCVDNLLDLVRNGGSSPADSLAAFFTPYLLRGQLRLIGEATPTELEACRRLLPAFAACFGVVEIPTFTHRQAVDALEQLAATWSGNLSIILDRPAIELIGHLFARFMPYAAFPGPAAGFTMSLCETAARQASRRLTSDLVIEQFVTMTGLPELFLRHDRALDVQEVAKSFGQRVIGQKEACESAAAVVTTFKAAMNEPGRPLGVLMFCGPTGVGKTELARTLSDFLFGHGEKKDRMVRLDMSEYAGPDAVDRVLGPPHGEASELIKRLRQQPFTVVLLDEIEKASNEVFDLLLGVLDEGRLTDRFGRLTTFRSAIIVMTSNLNSAATEPFGLTRSPAAGAASEVAGFFRPEFFNRIDAVVGFHPLGPQCIREIAVAELRKIGRREGLEHRAIELRWTDDVLARICEGGYDARYGARPLQRLIEQLIVAPLARLLLEKPGLKDACIALRLEDGAVVAAVKA